MNKYYKIVNGNKLIKFPQNIVIIKEGKQYINPSEDLILEDGWAIYEPTLEDSLENAINHKLRELEQYDTSESVNICYINNNDSTLSYWANKAERSILKTALQDCLSVGRQSYRLDLRDLEVSLEIECEKLLQMLSALEVYAIDCYNTTTDHMYAIKNLTSVAEVEAYNYTVGYPDKIVFDL